MNSRGRSKTTLTRQGRLVLLEMSTVCIFLLVHRGLLYTQFLLRVRYIWHVKQNFYRTVLIHKNSTFRFSINTFFATVCFIGTIEQVGVKRRKILVNVVYKRPQRVLQFSTHCTQLGLEQTLSRLKYWTCAIISRGLYYIFYLIFHFGL